MWARQSRQQGSSCLVRYLPHLWGPMAGEVSSHITKTQKMLTEALTMHRHLSFLTLNLMRLRGPQNSGEEMSGEVSARSLINYSEDYINVDLL